VCVAEISNQRTVAGLSGKRNAGAALAHRQAGPRISLALNPGYDWWLASRNLEGM
jgi:hypothetical protein